ncbi:MAG: MFS transporter [Chloroflexota bacterium]|nr:MFS transporter [Chloroflexota bacterium]
MQETASGPAPLPRLGFAALRVPLYRWYFGASWVSSAGDGMETVIRSLLVLQLAGDQAAFWLGMMVFAHWVPFTIFSLYGGTLADRYDARKVQLVAQLLLFAAGLGVALITIAGLVSVWWIFGFLLLHGFAGAIGNPAQQTLVHSIVGRDRLLSAVSLSSTSRQLSQVVGPAIAGLVFVAFGPGWGLLMNALSFAPLLLLLTLMRPPRAEISPPQATLDALREGIAFVRARPRLGALIGVEMLPVVFLGHTFHSLLPLFARDQLGADVLGYSFLLVASGLGALGAAVWLAYGRERKDPLRTVVIAAALEIAAILVFALSTSYGLALALMFCIGGAAVVAQALANTTLQLSAPDRIRGRVMGAYSFGTQGTRIVNGPLLGGLAQAIGPVAAVAGSAALVLAMLGGILAAVVRRDRGRLGPPETADLAGQTGGHSVPDWSEASSDASRHS